MDFSHLVANEIEIETSGGAEPNNEQKSKPHPAEPFFESSDYTNGALYDELNYCWSQTTTEIGKIIL